MTFSLPLYPINWFQHMIFWCIGFIDAGRRMYHRDRVHDTEPLQCLAIVPVSLVPLRPNSDSRVKTTMYIKPPSQP